MYICGFKKLIKIKISKVEVRFPMDAIIIADTGSESVSATTEFRFHIDGYTANIQTVNNYLKNEGRIIPPISGDEGLSWQSSLKLNGIYLYSYLSGHGLEVGLIDKYFEEKDRFLQMLKQSPKAVVISTTFIMRKKTLMSLVQDIRSVAPDIFIIAGGQFVHLSGRMRKNKISGTLDGFEDEYLFMNEKEDPQIDLYIISSSGEEILNNALMLLKKGMKVEGLANTAIYCGQKYSFSAEREDHFIKGGITVNWERMPKEFFASGVVPMQASYGCPYNCAFCNFMKDKRMMGLKPWGNLFSELKTVQEKGAKYIWFVDDNFRLGKPDLTQVCQKMIEQGIHVKWKSFIRPSALEEIDMDMLKAAGCLEVQFGLESADPVLLKKMNKGTKPDRYARVIEKILKADINCSCYFLFGFPGETKGTVSRTIEFIKSIEFPELAGCIYFSMFPFIVAPLSPISNPKMASEVGLKGSMYQWTHDTMNYKEAMKYAVNAFFQLETSGVNYPGDNLDMLYGLDLGGKKTFVALRHQLAKAALKGSVQEEYAFAALKKVCGNLLSAEEKR
jgi:anaerobic magnesium-protoporphyrin IX monomethyl ester cyclase